MTASALYCVGLDPYVGFMHKDRPGRVSLALDMIEELRAVFADRFVLTVINKKIVNKNDFFIKENGAVLLNDDGKKKIIKSWQNKKSLEIKHPFLEEKVELGVWFLMFSHYFLQDVLEVILMVIRPLCGSRCNLYACAYYL